MIPPPAQTDRPARQPGPAGQRGVTLLELMIAVVVIALLAMLVYPSYQNSVRKARRADATDGATAVLQAQERWRSSNPSYTAALTDLSVASSTGNGYYTMALSGATAAGYTLSFTPVAARGQGSDSGCTAMSVSVTNGTPSFLPTTCWSR